MDLLALFICCRFHEVTYEDVVSIAHEWRFATVRDRERFLR